MKKEKKDRAPPRTVRRERVVGDTRAATRDTRRDKNALMLLPSSKTSSDAPAAIFAVVRLERYPRSARGAASFGCRRAEDAAPRAGPWRRAQRAAVDAAAAASEASPRIVRVARPGRCEPPASADAPSRTRVGRTAAALSRKT